MAILLIVVYALDVIVGLRSKFSPNCTPSDTIFMLVIEIIIIHQVPSCYNNYVLDLEVTEMGFQLFIIILKLHIQRTNKFWGLLEDYMELLVC